MTSSYLLLNGLRFHYLHWEPAEPGRAVVLLHGLASNARIWELVAPRLAEAGHFVYALDQRGHGLSDKPEGDYGFETFRRDLLAFVDALSLERPLLVGHSWGALVALDFAAHFATGPRAPAALMMVDGGINRLQDAPGATWEAMRERLTPPRLAGTPLDDFLPNLTAWTSSWQTDERVPQIILANFEIEPDETIRPHLSFEHHMQIVRAMWDFDNYASLQRVRCPAAAVLAVPPEPRGEGEAGYLSLKQQGAIRARQVLPSLQVHWMADSVHDIPLHKPAELAGMILQLV